MDKKDKTFLPYLAGMVGAGWLSVSLASYIEFNYFNSDANELFISGIIIGCVLVVLSILLLHITCNKKKRIV